MKKQIPDFPDYCVHSYGYVVSYKNGKEKILVGGPAGAKGRKNYRMVTLREDGKQVGKLVHILVAQAFIPNPKNLPQVNHIDGNGKNNNVSNLEWSTAGDNIKHSVEAGLWTRPTDEHFKLMWRNSGSSRAVFTLEEGSEIMEMKDALGISGNEMAKLVGCSRPAIQRLVRGEMKNFKNGTL